MTSTARLAMITLDCADPAASGAFWSALLGWEVAASSEDYAMLTGPSHALGSDPGRELGLTRPLPAFFAGGSSTSTWPSMGRRSKTGSPRTGG